MICPSKNQEIRKSFLTITGILALASLPVFAPPFYRKGK